MEKKSKIVWSCRRGGGGGVSKLQTQSEVLCFFFLNLSLISENYPLCLNPIFDFWNMTFKHKLYINMVKF